VTRKIGVSWDVTLFRVLEIQILRCNLPGILRIEDGGIGFLRNAVIHLPDVSGILGYRNKLLVGDWLFS
jgi:hypothetical protein